MFDSLKKKLSLFKKKAEDRLPESIEGDVVVKSETPSTPEVKGVKPPEPAREKPKRGLFGEGGRRINEEALEELLWDLEVELMEADVALEVVEEIKSGVKSSLTGSKIGKRSDLGEVVTEALREAIRGVLSQNEFDFDGFISSQEKPVVIMFVGINGTGKTTVIAKVANRMIGRGVSCVLSASDTFRAGAIEQLTIHGDRLGCKVIKHKAGGDPAAVAYDAVEHAKARRKDVVLVDTAGRMQTNANLMDEMKKIKRVAKPDLVIFVGDSLAGNDAIEQARAFNAVVGIDAVILTKIDADCRGGAALSIAYTVGKPLVFLSTGQEYDQFVKYDPKWMIDRIFS